MSTMMIPGQYGGGYGGYGGGYGGYGGGYGGNGGYGGGIPGGGYPPQFPQFPQGGGEYQQTLPGAHTGGISIGGGGGLFGGFSVQQNEGYGLDFNKNGRYDRGTDGVLVFDTNRDGKYDKKDVQRTNNMMQAATGNFDFNNDGKVSMGERLSGSMLRRKYQQMDQNRDGRLSTNEISQGGGRVWQDQNRDGRVNGGETNSAYSMPSGFLGRNERLDFVDPFGQTSHTSPNQFNNGPFGGGGYPGCGCHGGGGGGMFPTGGGWTGNMGTYGNPGMFNNGGANYGGY